MSNYLKIALYQFNSVVGDLSANTDKIIKAIDEAKANQCDLFIMPELAICGYPPEDLLFRSNFKEQVKAQLQRLLQVKDITVLVSCPSFDETILHNSVYVIKDGRILARYDKQLLPNYGVFDEKRYFSSGEHSVIVTCKDVKIGVIICEDMWGSEPILSASQLGAEIICVLNASPYAKHKHQERLNVAKARITEAGLPIIYVNAIGGQDELIFDGASFIMDAKQNIVVQLPMAREHLGFVNYAAGLFASTTSNAPEAHNPYPDFYHHHYPDQIEGMYHALTLAVKDYVIKNKFKKVILGLSGGIDSALTLAIACDALGKDMVSVVMLPSRYTAAMSIADAKQMAQILGVSYQEISIEPILEQLITSISVNGNEVTGITLENLQARARGIIIMALSNSTGALVLTTGNKSEMAVGYATLYGDMAGGFAPLKDVLKTEVYQLAKWRNLHREIIPHNIITRSPTAELRENQTDQDSLPDYDILDNILQLMVEHECSSQDVIAKGYASEQVLLVAKLLKISEYKRQQSAIGPKVSHVSFTKDWRYPITHHYEY